MRNVWKGLTVGAFAGATVGIVLDALDRIGHRTAEAAGRAHDRTVEVAEQVREHALGGSDHE